MTSLLKYHKLDPKEALIQVKPREGEATFRTEDILAKIEEEGDSIAVIMLSGLQYYTGEP